jgi:hypothetical protein
MNTTRFWRDAKILGNGQMEKRELGEDGYGLPTVLLRYV